MIIQISILFLGLYMIKFFHDEKQRAMIKWQHEKSNRMYIFWIVFTLVQMLVITSRFSGNQYIYQTMLIISQSLSLIYLYMALEQIFG